LFPGVFLFALLPEEKAVSLKVWIMPKILVALNDSPTSEQALATAVTLAQSQNGQLAAVAVVEHPRTPGFAALKNDLAAEVRARLDELLQSAVNFAQSRGVSLVPILREGNAAYAILDCAEQERVDLLVLGGGSAPGDNHGLGSTADQVSNHCACDVLLVKQRATVSTHAKTDR
jgi:nucleotide-binding universal stress UspA family protein